MPKVLRLHQLGLNVEDWQQTNQLAASEIKDIQDGAGAKATKVSTSIPTPFARMHLFETAFSFVRQESTSQSTTIYHKMVSQFWDLWELLFNYELYIQGEQKIIIRRWRRESEIQSMVNNPGSYLLGKTIKLYAGSDKRFQDFQDLYFFYFEYQDQYGDRHQELLGGTSPFTLLFVAPHVSVLPLERLQSKGRYFDNQYVPLEERDEAFRTFVYELFSATPEYIAKYPAVYNSLDQRRLNMIAMDGGVKLNKYTRLNDFEGNPVSVGYFPFLIKNEEQENEIGSDLFIQPTRANTELLPIVLKPKLKLTGKVKYFNNFTWSDTTGDEVPFTDSKPLEERTLPGKGVRYPYLTINDFLEETLIELPYEINQDRFHCGVVKYQPGTDKTFSYLLPITSRYFDYFTEKDLADHLQFFIDLNHVKVSLCIPVANAEPIIYERSYYTNPQNQKDKNGNEIPEKGRIVEALVGIGVFPFYKFIDHPQYNDFYKVMLIDEDMEPEMRNKNYELKFFVGSEPLGKEGGVKGVKVTERSGKSEVTVGSKYYEITGTHFDYAEVHCPGKYSGKGLFIPKFQPIEKGTKSFTFAIDFGTTNTYVSFSHSDSIEEPETFAITAKDLQLVMLNSPSKDSSLTDYQKYSRGFGTRMQNTYAVAKREFLPAIISDGGSPYQFPIRTATFEVPNFKIQTPSIFGNINIGFTINTESTEDFSEYYHTNLKWSTGDLIGQRRVEAFFKELMLLIKNKVALNRGIIENTKIVWFAPISFNSFARNLFQNEWDTVYQQVFKNGKGTVSMTESVAPYHYLRLKGKVSPAKEEGLVNIDIGGGTTDVLLFMNQKPAYSFSYRFAGDDIWGDGYALIKSGRDNGLMLYGKDKINAMPFSDRESEIKSYLSVAADRNKGFNSTDIVSLMFNYDEAFQYSKLLQQAPTLRLIFYLHFGIILYQLAQTIRAANMPIPRYICFSGRGSLYIKILSAGPNLSGIEKFAKAVLHTVIGKPAPANFRIILVENPKQTTANGGVLAINSLDISGQEEISVITPLGIDNEDIHVNGTSKESITNEVIRKVLANAEDCLELLLNNDAITSLMKDLGVEFDRETIMPFLKEQLADSFTIGFEQLEQQLKAKEPLPETLFFLPFKQTLYSLSKKLYEDQKNG